MPTERKRLTSRILLRLTNLLQRRARSADARLAHVAAMAVGIVAASGVEKAAVIPEDDVARLPSMDVDVFGLDRCFGQFVDQGAAGGLAHALDLPDVGAEEQVLGTRRGLIRTSR